MKIILIGNYKPDKQESMIRFAYMLLEGFSKEGIETSIWEPNIFLGGLFGNTKKGFVKWVGYIDKWLLFPIILKLKSITLELNNQKQVKYHICDHSNSMYYKYLPQHRTSITCHDVLAIKGSLGYKDAYCTSTKAGKYLQKIILSNLIKINKIVCVSTFTLNELTSLASNEKPKSANWQMIPNSFNNSFNKILKINKNFILEELKINEEIPYILHIGSSHERKNRQILIQLLGLIKNEWNGILLFAGENLNIELLKMVEKFELKNRIIDLGKVSHHQLVNLYSNCFAFIFPSFSEGFGWPIIEAQACEAPVITVNLAPMNEVAGEGAIFADPNDATTFKSALYKLKDDGFKLDLIAKGKKNIERYQSSLVIDSYLKFINS